MPPDTTKVDRSTFFGNPFTADRREVAEAVALFREWLTSASWYPDNEHKYPPLVRKHLLEHRERVLAELPKLRRNLACWCALPAKDEADPCHASVLLELANDNES
jgi:hypothetical protein